MEETLQPGSVLLALTARLAGGDHSGRAAGGLCGHRRPLYRASDIWCSWGSGRVKTVCSARKVCRRSQVVGLVSVTISWLYISRQKNTWRERRRASSSPCSLKLSVTYADQRRCRGAICCATSAIDASEASTCAVSRRFCSASSWICQRKAKQMRSSGISRTLAQLLPCRVCKLASGRAA